MRKINTSGGISIEGNLNIESGDFVGRDHFVNINGDIINITGLDRISLEVLNALIQRLKSKDLPSRKLVFEFHVEPIFQRIKVVHEDYQRSIFEFQTLLHRKLEVSSATAHEWLKLRSLLYKADRRLLKNVEEELSMVRTALNNDSIFVAAIFDFSQAILRYLYSQSEVIPEKTSTTVFYIRHGHGMGYTQLVREIEFLEKARDFEGDLENMPSNIREIIKSIRSKELAPEQLIENLLNDVSIGLPEKWQEVCKNYLKLKGLSLL